MNIKAIRSNITVNELHLTNIKNEIIEIINTMLEAQPIFNCDESVEIPVDCRGFEFIVNSVEKSDDNETIVTGTDVEREHIEIVINELELSVLIPIADFMCKELELKN